MSDSVRPHRQQPTRLPRPWDSPGKNTGVCCHFLLQCMKVKSESEVAQSCPTLSDPVDCSFPGSSVHGIFQARVLEWGAIPFSVSSSLNVWQNSPVKPSGPGLLFFGIVLKVLHSICQQIWKTQQWPQDWKRSVFIPIPKKGNAKNAQTTTQLL